MSSTALNLSESSGEGQHDPGWRAKDWMRWGAVAMLCLAAVGCDGPPASSEKELARFRKAGPLVPQLDRDKLLEAAAPRMKKSPVPGDLLRIYMPQVLATVKDGLDVPEEEAGSHTARVQPDGTILAPLVGAVDISGLSLMEIERKLSNEYFPELVEPKPSIRVSIEEYHTEPVTVTGDVEEPGVYRLRSYEMNLVAALSEAGGLSGVGARGVWVRRSGEGVKEVMLPVKEAEGGFQNVELLPGDQIRVKGVPKRVISVVGLVNEPGTIEAPVDRRLTLMEALARAGGLNQIAAPKYVNVYRRAMPDEDAPSADTTPIVAARFRVAGIAGATGLPQGASELLKPGDVVAVENTIRTSARLILKEVVRVGIGFDYDPTDRHN